MNPAKTINCAQADISEAEGLEYGIIFFMN